MTSKGQAATGDGVGWDGMEGACWTYPPVTGNKMGLRCLRQSRRGWTHRRGVFLLQDFASKQAHVHRAPN